MIKVNNTELRNLEEQVQFNSNRIDAIIEGNEVLAKMGIQVVGQVNEKSQLPDPATYAGDFGDAYLVGINPPYDYYIYTRPFAGETVPQWFELGQFPVAGPQGPQGVQGPVGPRGYSTEWYVGADDPNGRTSANPDDLYLRLTAPNNEYNGMVYVCEGGNQWTLQSSIQGPQGVRGPQGIQGPQGESIVGPQGPQGPAGQFITIKGELTNVDQLPDPESVGRESAYLIPIADVNHVFLIVGDETLSWVDAGSFGQGGTKVTVGGVYQQNFNADTKVNTLGPSSSYRVYANNAGVDTGLYYSASPGNSYIVARTAQGQITLPDQATKIPDDDQAISKKYADDNYTKKGSAVSIYDNTGSGLVRIYGCGPYAKGAGMYIASDRYVNLGTALVMRNATTGSFLVPTPTENEHPANKAYVDSKVVETHKVTSRNASTYDQLEDLGVVSRNAHHRVHVQDGVGCWLADGYGTKIASLYNMEIPEFSDAEICYGDEGTYGYITISNTTYIFNSPAEPLHIFATSADVYMITHI